MTDIKRMTSSTLQEALEELEVGEECWIDVAHLTQIEPDMVEAYRCVGWEVIPVWKRHLERGFNYNIWGMMKLDEDDIKA